MQEWNYYSRRDAKATIIIANATKFDSRQMRYGTYKPSPLLARISNPFFIKYFHR